MTNKEVYTGRKRIYSDARQINEKNIIDVLGKALIEHMSNAEQIKYLLNYEAGDQPLQRPKKIRSDINVKVCDNLANEITEFKLGYNYGNPITYIQRSDKDLKGNTPEEDDKAILLLNEMLEFECASSLDQEMLRFMEICGIGFQMVDIKMDYEEGEAVFDLITLNPLNTFIVYDTSVKHNPLMGVVFSESENGEIHYTCFTNSKRYEVTAQLVIDNNKESVSFNFGKRSGEKNPLGRIPIVEFNRSHDRMGCFERQISDMDNLNILVSDFTNNVAQDTQALWWGNDFEFPVDPTTGQQTPPKSGQWIITQSTQEGKTPKVQPLVINTKYEGILNNIKYRRDIIKQKCSVPVQQESNSGATGMAMSMSTGWQAAEVSALREAQMVVRGKMKIAGLIIKAIKISPNTPSDSPLLKLSLSDIKPSLIRNKTYDLVNKVNAYATLISHGVHPRHCLSVVEAFADPNLVYEDSKPYLEDYLDLIKKDEPKDRNQSDYSDQIGQSPYLDGINSGEEKVDANPNN